MKLKRGIKVFLVLIILLLVSFFVYKGVLLYQDIVLTKDLKELAYSDEAINTIKTLEIGEYIVEKNYESNLLNEAFQDISYDYVTNYNKLLSKYNLDEVLIIFEYLAKKDIEYLESLSYDPNIFNYIKNDIFNIEYLERYENYYVKKPELDYDTIITYVNIGLDNKFYTNINSISNPSDLLVLCNKYNQLPSDYEPEDLVKIDSKFSNSARYLRKEAYDAFIKLANEMDDLGYDIYATSAYRSYDYQENLYDNYVKRDGKEEADTYSARAGHSEHQTGLAVDLGSSNGNWAWFKYTDEYKWIVDNAFKYGFIIRYPEGKEDITGYTYESWHLRYVGNNIAKYIHENDTTYDEYYINFLQ